MDNLAAPITIGEDFYIKSNDFYSCSKCSSDIEILSIDDKESKITFNCLNNEENTNHKIQEMNIHEYLEKMEKNNYQYDECSICHNKQNYIKNLLIFNYCINCKVIVCNNCKNKHLEKKSIEHSFIKNNEKRNKCLFHSNNNNNIVYCFDCKRHLCKECLKTRKHLLHKKVNISEILILDEEKVILNEIICILKRNKKELQNEAKINDFNINENTIENNYKKEFDEINNKSNNEIKLNEDKHKKELQSLELGYIIQKMKINNKYKEIYNKIKEKGRILIEEKNK